jgi:hypothetical protein
MGLLGFTFRETMRGSYHLLAEPLVERAIEFTIDAKVDGMRRFLRDRTARIAGTVSVEGFAAPTPLTGTLGLKLLDERRLPYDFRFRADDGHDYRFHGQKDVTMIGLHDTMTTLPASFYDAGGAEIGRAVLRFDLRSDWRAFLRSWRLEVPAWTA